MRMVLESRASSASVSSQDSGKDVVAACEKVFITHIYNTRPNLGLGEVQADRHTKSLKFDR